MCICRILLVIFTVGQWFSLRTDPIKGILEVVRIFKRVIGVLWHKKRNTYLVFAPGSWHKAPKTFPISWVISILLLLLCCTASVVSDSVWLHRWQPTRLPVPGIFQARTLEWVAISFSNAWKWKVKVKLLSRVWLLATPWTAAYQAPPSMGFSRWEYWSGVPLHARSVLLTMQDGHQKVQVMIRGLEISSPLILWGEKRG